MYFEVSNPADYRVALYIRLSKEDENEGQSESVSNQQSMLNQFVKEHQLCVYNTYIDDGWSGTNFDRPGFGQMIQDIESGKVNMVITKDLSRLGRDYILTGHYMERYFPEHKVRYISLLDGVDTGIESTANDITPFRAIMNDMYAKDISKKISSVKHDKQRKGEFIGGKPVYGYKMHPTEKNKIVIDEDAAPIVRHVFAMAIKGISCRQIAVQLNNEGIPTPAAYAGITVSRSGPYTGKWSSERIAAMLKNEAYIGNMVQGRVRKVNYKSKKCIRLPSEEWVVVKGTHEPIVDAETFHKVNQLIESRKHTRRRKYDFLLKGMIFCHECGHPLAVINRRNSKGEECLYFVCRTYQRFTKAGVCTGHYIKEQIVTEAVQEQVKRVCRSYLKQEALLPIAERETEQARERQKLEQQTAALKSKIKSLSVNLDRTYMDRLNGVLDDEDFTRIYENMKQERTRFEKRLVELLENKPSSTDQKALAKALVERFIKSISYNRELLVSLVECVELTEDKQVIIRFRFKELGASTQKLDVPESHL